MKYKMRWIQTLRQRFQYLSLEQLRDRDFCSAEMWLNIKYIWLISPFFGEIAF